MSERNSEELTQQQTFFYSAKGETMSDDLSKSESGKGVSPQRKAVSAIILIALLVVLAIELRAGAGQIMTGNALKEVAPEGTFEQASLSRADVEGMLKLSPSVNPVGESSHEEEVRYSWFSLLRPLLQRPQADVYVVYSKGDPPMAVRHGTEPPGENEYEKNTYEPGAADDAVDAVPPDSSGGNPDADADADSDAEPSDSDSDDEA
ncbi:hypothetical protein [Fuerstiella marisgermanici]|uniref:Uncharacterized protein n=1 Tax=Fuerstiella marisgermanici TaxID=1891926 RepID=A0A1P8WHE6_9PLAN|nr:hypothetical protein [Fuerstiella marisgermanici]APZ93491.1 hypothetical protein Fuma_03109 [Fuerstiella marisgermanici]